MNAPRLRIVSDTAELNKIVLIIGLYRRIEFELEQNSIKEVNIAAFSDFRSCNKDDP